MAIALYDLEERMARLTPRERALELLKTALETGIRGKNREAVLLAIRTIETEEQGLTDLNYRNCAPGKYLWKS